jgi:hypothetical protein
MTLKLCQGPDCHTYHTQDRLKGMKGSKTYQTRRRSSFYYLGGNACDMRCQDNWLNKFGEQAVNHFGRIKEVKHLREHNAWTKDYDWADSTSYENRDKTYYYRNMITNERRPLTEDQYNDTNYTLNTGE